MAESKLITILFADICGSTRLFELRGDVAAGQLISHVLTLLSEVAREHGGQVIKTIGDEIMCTFADGANALLAAIGMQRRISGDQACASENLGIRIGLHSGGALFERDDVYGHAVNMASHIAALAKREQIITTATTAGDTSPDAVSARPLGAVHINGRMLPIEIIEVVWHDMSSATMLRPASASDGRAELAPAKLTLRYLGRSFQLEATSLPFTVGRDSKSSLVIDAEWTSRNHAVIEYRRGHFILSEHSTNGTWMTIGSEGEVRLHRDQLYLRKTGMISFGQPIAAPGSISVLFECTGES